MHLRTPAITYHAAPERYACVRRAVPRNACSVVGSVDAGGTGKTRTPGLREARPVSSGTTTSAKMQAQPRSRRPSPGHSIRHSYCWQEGENGRCPGPNWCKQLREQRWVHSIDGRSLPENIGNESAPVRQGLGRYMRM